MSVGGVDTYYDYDERKWKSRRLGGHPIRTGPVCPVLPRRPPADAADEELVDQSDPVGETVRTGAR